MILLYTETIMIKPLLSGAKLPNGKKLKKVMP